MTAHSEITGLILAGGRGTRMGRVDKGLQPFRGTTLVHNVLQRLSPQVHKAIINANRNLPQYQAAAGDGVPVMADRMGGFEGPLAGLQTGLQACTTDLLLTVPCDSPFLPLDLAARLHAALQVEDADVAIAVTLEQDPEAVADPQTPAHDGAGTLQRQRHPVFSLLKASLLPQLDAYLATGARRIQGWHQTLRVAEVLFDDARAFRNINTLEDLQRSEREAAATLGGAPAGAGEPAPAPTSATTAPAAAAPSEPPGESGTLSVEEARRCIAQRVTPLDAIPVMVRWLQQNEIGRAHV